MVVNNAVEVIFSYSVHLAETKEVYSLSEFIFIKLHLLWSPIGTDHQLGSLPPVLNVVSRTGIQTRTGRNQYRPFPCLGRLSVVWFLPKLSGLFTFQEG